MAKHYVCLYFSTQEAEGIMNLKWFKLPNKTLPSFLQKNKFKNKVNI